MSTELSTFLRIVNPKSSSIHGSEAVPPCDFLKPEDMAIQYTYPLDPFQQHAIAAISRDENVLVTAKTGSGKTLVGEYQIAHSLRKGRRVFYTTPIKSLSNQKFHDLSQLYPSVGIMTGDIKFKPDADVIVMTTEILRNLLYKEGTSTASVGLTAALSLENLDAVVFDEVHYINDPSRGKVWEETMVLLPPAVNLVMLSATIDAAELFASWLGDLKQKPIHLISTEYRVVPLLHAVLDTNMEPLVIQDAKEVFYDKVYRDWIRGRDGRIKAHDDHKKKVAAREEGQTAIGAAEGKVVLYSFQHQINQLIQCMHERGELPALFFVFSRAQCEKLAAQVQGSVIDSSDSAVVGHLIDKLTYRYKELQKVPQFNQLRELLVRGIAFHHSGLLPILKEVVEIIFAKGYVKLLFATETFAVGINMPTKTVVFTGFRKYSDDGLRTLRTDEYIQMAGRAGRRGKDTRGLVLYLPEREPISLLEMKEMMTGRKATISSRMDFHYDFILKTVHSECTTWINMMEKSYWFQQLKRERDRTKISVAAYETRMKAMGFSSDVISGLTERRHLEAAVKGTGNAAKKDAQRAFDRWNNSHMGPVWNTAMKKWPEYVVLLKQKEELERYLQESEQYDSELQTRIQFLVDAGYLKNEPTLSLTKKGILATEVNEAHQFLLVESHAAGLLDNLTMEETVAWLALFLREKAKDDSPTTSSDCCPFGQLRMTIQKTEAIAAGFAKKDGQPDLWSLNYGYVDMISALMEKEDAATRGSSLCVEFGVYEGTLYRIIMSLKNMLEELVTVATLSEDLQLVDKLSNVRKNLNCNFVVADSLYLHM